MPFQAVLILRQVVFLC